MKRNIPTFLFMLIAATALTIFPVSAENSLSKEEIKSVIWEDVWHGKDDNGKAFLEASYKYHLLDKWVDEHYNDEVYDNIGEWTYGYKRYYSDLTEDWHFSDDRLGNWTIIDEDGNVYGFTYSGGKWLESNQNRDVIDSFPAYNTLDEPKPNLSDVPDKSGGAMIKGVLPSESHRTADSDVLKADGKVVADSTNTSQNADSEPSEHSDSRNIAPIVYVLATVVIAGGITIIIIAVKRRK